MSNFINVACLKNNDSKSKYKLDFFPNFIDNKSIDDCDKLATAAGSSYFGLYVDKIVDKNVPRCLYGDAKSMELISKKPEPQLSTDCATKEAYGNYKYGNTASSTAVYMTKAAANKKLTDAKTTVKSTDVNVTVKPTNMTKLFLECTQSQNKIQCTLQM